jgi:hypothetical protein
MPPAAKLLAVLIVMSLCGWIIVARVHVLPWVDARPKRDALLVLVTPQMFRTIGAMSLLPGIGDPPPEWSIPLAWGDGMTAALAMLAMVALQTRWSHATKMVWASAVFGLLDLLHNVYNSITMQVAPRLGPLAYVVAFGVPMMLVFHVLAIRTLLEKEPTLTDGAAQARSSEQ